MHLVISAWGVAAWCIVVVFTTLAAQAPVAVRIDGDIPRIVISRLAAIVEIVVGAICPWVCGWASRCLAAQAYALKEAPFEIGSLKRTFVKMGVPHHTRAQLFE